MIVTTVVVQVPASVGAAPGTVRGRFWMRRYDLAQGLPVVFDLGGTGQTQA
ncbi:hypothetical protein AB0M50_30100 [Nonomuraea fuscirosea]|uniref:hypothetical protein n=1 Tax=Nonomuraea fuscirosea TaxID=1291556 RepID=UPI003424078E